MLNHTSQPCPLSIGIAGGGLLGRLLAWRLHSQGHQVTVFDKGGPQRDPSAAYTAAGMLAPVSEAAASHPAIFQAGIAAIDTWQQWCRELKLEDALHHSGSLIVAHPQDRAELIQFEQDCQRIGASQSLNVTRLDHQGIARLEPDLNPQFEQGLWVNPEAHLDNRQVLSRLDQILTEAGITRHYQSEVQVHANEIKNLNGGKPLRFDWVIDCRGAGARFDQSNLRGVRGETLHIQTREVVLQRPVRLLHPRYQLYIVPKPGHRFVIGATQIESEDDSPISLQSTLELSSALYTLAPAFAEARVLEAGVNLRPAYTSNLPQVDCEAGLIRANGLFRHGYLLAPLVVEQTLSIINGRNNRACEQLSSLAKAS